MPNHTEDIRKEELIARKWKFKPANTSSFPEGILVTGANSFIGSHVVKLLQDKWGGPVYLLIRASSIREGAQKMQKAFSKWELGEFREDRATLCLGDVSRSSMGLSGSEYSEVKLNTGKVVHLAMTPLYHLPYVHFKRMWVPELERMIAFCGDHKAPKSLHYASSFNANFFTGENDFKALNTNAWQSGYAGFKWVANQAIKNAFHHNLKGCVYDIPLVLGTESKGICPTHYSVWLILDIFLRTGSFIKFSFRVIPVDVLADIMVYNVLQEDQDSPAHFVRPVLDEPVDNLMFSRIAANLLGLKERSLAEVRDACLNKLRFDFMIPGNFYELLDKVSRLQQVLPCGYDPSGMPGTPLVFMSNLNRILAQNKELSIENGQSK